jgi:hypothetical protein
MLTADPRSLMDIPEEPDYAALEEDVLDPNDSEKLSDSHRGQTKLHAHPPRLEDEGQCGG